MSVMQGIEQELVLNDNSGDDDDSCHLWCCNPDWSLCGIDISGHPIKFGEITDDIVCPLCDLMMQEDLPCPLCHSNCDSST